MKVSGGRGMTLFEVLVATLVFIVALSALSEGVLKVVELIDIARCQTIAVGDLGNILEKIRATSFDAVTTLFPAGDVDGPPSNPYINITGGYALGNEHITVSYPDPNDDPLEIAANITWQGKLGRTYTASLSTIKTR